MLGPVLALSGLDATNGWKQTTVKDRDLAAYVRTELRGDGSRLRAPVARATIRSATAGRLRPWFGRLRGRSVHDRAAAGQDAP